MQIIEGMGVMLYTDGSIYEGFWKADKYHGRGRTIWSSGSCYEGNWAKELKEGKGTSQITLGPLGLEDAQQRQSWAYTAP